MQEDSRLFLTQHTTFTQSRQKWTGFLGLQVGLGSTPCQARKEDGSWFIITGHRWFDQAVAQTLAAVKHTTTRPRLRPLCSQSNSRPVSTIPRVYSILKWGDNHVQFCFYLFTMCCKKWRRLCIDGASLNCSDSHFPQSLCKVGNMRSPGLPYFPMPRQASCWKSGESRNYKCFLCKRIGDDKIPALNLRARVSPMFSSSAFLGGANVANTEVSLVPFITAKCHSPQVDCVWPSINFKSSVLRYPNSQTVHTDENQLATQSLSLLLEFSQMIFFLRPLPKYRRATS